MLFKDLISESKFIKFKDNKSKLSNDIEEIMSGAMGIEWKSVKVNDDEKNITVILKNNEDAENLELHIIDEESINAKEFNKKWRANLKISSTKNAVAFTWNWQD